MNKFHNDDIDVLGLEVTEHANAMLAYWDKDLICRFANKAYIEWFGVDPEQMINKMHISKLLGRLFQKNLVRWKYWKPQTPDTAGRLKQAQDAIAECDRRIGQ